MIATEIDKEKGIYRRRYLPESKHQSAFVLLNTQPGFSNQYADETLEYYLDRAAAVDCQFIAGSRIYGEKDLALELAFKDGSGMATFVKALEDDRVFQGGGIRRSVFHFEDASLRSPGLPWSDARREAYIFSTNKRF